jgi:UDP-N-acetylmuramate--alanine ligase
MHEWEQAPGIVMETILSRFTFPFYVKAVHLGSTFGVFRVKTPQEVKTAIAEIRQLDYRFLVEEEVKGRELEFGLLGNFDVEVADPAEVVRAEEIHTYENKYSAKGLPSIPKVPLPPDILAKGKEAALAVYKAVGCTGFARIDFFLKEGGRWVLNEVNPIPGFTPTSVYPLIWQTEGLPLGALVEQIIIAGLHRFRYCHRRLRPPLKPPVQL